MSEERLKEIKDSIDLQHRMAVRFDMDNDVIGLIDEELELYNEVVRLREEIKKLKELLEPITIKIEGLPNTNLTLEQLTGVENE